MSIAVEFDVEGTRYLSLGLNAVQRYFGNTRGLMRQMGAAVESQTRRRIQDEKEAPDGTPWVPWSEEYAATRHGNQSLLINQGHLLNSIRAGLVTDDAVVIGTHLDYGAFHQFGVPFHVSRELGGIPARPFLDVEFEHDANRQELGLILKDWIDAGGEAARPYERRR